ncbi:MAG TPA: ATP-binding protein [Candidatus Dormibacteraeota bacterium]|nr:ATP-binding protein [Candidatus Dormibacteraeota bacterium]
MAQRLSWDPALVERLLGGLALTVLGQLGLPEPLSRLVVFGRSDTQPDGRIALAAVLVPTARGGAVALGPFGLGPHPAATRVPGDAAARFRSRPVGGGGFFVLDDDGEPRFLVASGIVRQTTVSCGTWPVLMQLAGPRAPARPVADRDQVRTELAAFCQVVEAVVDAVYEADAMPVPDYRLALTPTGVGVGTALGGLRKVTRGTADLFSRVQGGRPPGEVYDPAADAASGEEPTRFDDVGGQDAARAELETICLAVRQPDAFRAWGARPPRGVLLHGPPGTGKTMLARALAHEAGARFIHVRATDVVSKWYGEAERRVQQAFDRARAETPAVLFFDEVDALARDRQLSHEATHRIVSTFLENMDGLREVEGVVVLAATNRPEAVDDALLRPGRFDRLVDVPLPDREGRRAIFQVHMRRAERRARRTLFADLDPDQWSSLLDSTEGFSGADVAETVRRALEEKVRSGATAGEIQPDELLSKVAGVGRQF